MRALLAALLFFCGASAAFASPEFPALTSRVFDGAGILSPATKAQLEKKLAEYEAGTTNQVVVATVTTLNGADIAEYGVSLARHWQIGQRGENNGVLLLVAYVEHKLRIEVGYGLEGILTDAQSSAIINEVMVPQFKAGHMEEGIIAGTQAILDVLGGKPRPVATQQQPGTLFSFFVLLILCLLFKWTLGRGILFLPVGTGGSYYGRSGSGGWGSGGGYGGGFSGGGGSFGGGGSSGGW